MTERERREYQIEGFSKTKSGHIPYKYRRPFWLPALNYYVLAVVLSIAFFLILWGTLHEENDEEAWILSAFAAIGVITVAVFLREVILRKARTRYLLAQGRLDANLKSIPPPMMTGMRDTNKLSLEKNAALVKDIRQKSDAAKALGKFAEGHLEVFQMCDRYLSLNRRQLETVGIGSPRLAALRRGNEIISELHHFHLLSWAQNETRSLTQESKFRVTISEKLESAQRALAALDSALEFYPQDIQLLESKIALKEFITSIKVSHWMEQAERAAFKGNFKRAISHYRDALFFMARENVQNDERESIAGKINFEIENLQKLSLKSGAGKSDLETPI